MKVLLSCGGTGGHIYPALAVAEKLEDCFFVGGSRLEKKLIPHAGFRFYEIPASPKNIFKIIKGTIRSLQIIKKEQPDLILCTGGYTTIPVALAAKLTGKKLFLQEQNILPGKANRLLGKLSQKIFISFAGSQKYFNTKKTVLTGNPVRENIARVKYNQANLDADTVLVFGGSLSSKAISETVNALVKKYLPSFKIIHLDGSNYTHDMAALYQKATLTVCRAGATSLAELSAIGLPAILIPYPYAANDHQMFNALYFAENGAAQIINEKELTPEKLWENIQSLLNNKEELKKMSEKMAQTATKNSAELIARQLQIA